jgi:hypothetical protein
MTAAHREEVFAENFGASVRVLEKHYYRFLNHERRARFDRMPGFV